MNTNEEKVIKIGLYKALGVVATAVLVSGVGGAFVAYRTLNTDHFTLLANTQEIDAMDKRLSRDEELVPEFRVVQSNISDLKLSVSEIKTSVDNVNEKLNQLLGKIGK